MNNKTKDKTSKHVSAMRKQKENIDSSIKEATIDRGICILLTGNGKGKTSSAFGMVMRALGYNQHVAIIQFIKGTQKSGEELYIQSLIKTLESPSLFLYQMGTGFTWETQSRKVDMKAAINTWDIAKGLLAREDINLVILDELTYMLAYKYLDEDDVINSIIKRPFNQNVVITGRGGGKRLREIADTVSEIKDIKHAYRSGIKARKGLDY